MEDDWGYPTSETSKSPSAPEKSTQELLDLRLQTGASGVSVEDLQGFVLSSQGRELRKAIERLGRSLGDLEEKLRKLTGRWR